MSLRIIGGAFRNRPIKSPKGEQTRPTLAIMRKAVFDILQTSIEQAYFLDLYAGSGAMGLEALSRGADHVTFIDSNSQALRCIEENIQHLGVKDQCTLISYDCLKALKNLVKQKKQFNLIYADPPYATASKLKLLHEILIFLDTQPLVLNNGTLFLEESFPATLHPETLSLTSLRHVDTRTFSHSLLHQFRKINVQT